ncbi:Cyclin-dependent kinase 2 [Binucleata daphniae]
MEYMSFDLSSLISLKVDFTENLIVSITHQILLALSHLHKNKILHRDIKPGNILLNKNGVAKLADFGLARNIDTAMTNRVSTLWYRAPELLLGSNTYDDKIDSFSLGLVILSMKNINFRGNGEIEQTILIFDKFGMPVTNYKWSNMFEVDKYKKNKPWYMIMDEEYGKIFSYKLLELVSELLRLEPRQRISCTRALQFQVFEDVKITEIDCGFDEMHEMEIDKLKKNK